MIPTNKLRWFIRNSWGGPEKVLQQWWRTDIVKVGEEANVTVHFGTGEWRDVPVEPETDERG